ncbi:MAG TPA: hypothetical protein VHD91_05245 [Gaiellaceae bacterium]|nr:hypothetical protein [Gaiellaceae bacterium]
MSAWLAAAYAALALGLAWVVAGGASWKVRAPYVVLAPALALALWLGRPDAAGWPSVAALPAHAQLHWAVVDEPDPATSDPGRIYLWLDVGAAKPRAYSLPYSRQMHEQVQRALVQLKRGRPISVSRVAHRSRSAKGGGGGSGASSVRFDAAPPPGLPPKTR